MPRQGLLSRKYAQIDLSSPSLAIPWLRSTSGGRLMIRIAFIDSSLRRFSEELPRI
jgi:hypothetical protein